MEPNFAIILGNGTTRTCQEARRSSLVRLGVPTFGCNAIYREFAPDYKSPDWLIAIDDGMIEEIRRSSFPSDRVIIPPSDERWEPAEINPGRPRSNAGINAIREAIKKGHNTLLCCGFDFLLRDPTQSVSNVFEGTANYTAATRAVERENEGRCRYLDWVAKSNRDVHMFFVFPTYMLGSHNDKIRFVTATNINAITYHNFWANVEGMEEFTNE